MRPRGFGEWVWLFGAMLCAAVSSGCDRAAKSSDKLSDGWSDVANVADDVPIQDTEEGCQALRRRFSQVRCLTKMARRRHDVKLCDLADGIIPSPGCYEALARADNDPSHCAKIKHTLQRESCWLEVVQGTYDPATCRLLDNPALRGKCLEKIVKYKPEQFALCDEVRRRDACYADAAAHDRPQLCQRVGGNADAPLRRACFVQALQPYRKYNREDCLKIEDAEPRDECLAQLGARQLSAGACPGMSNPETADTCWFYAAATQREACVHITNPDLKRRCARENWRASSSPELCELLDSPTLRALCLKQAATDENVSAR